MIQLTRLNGEAFILNAELIQYESRPDTYVTLTHVGPFHRAGVDGGSGAAGGRVLANDSATRRALMLACMGLGMR